MSDILYYEIHVTLEPEFDRVDKALELAEKYNFRMANLLMRRQDGNMESSRDDMFFSTRLNTLNDAISKTMSFCWELTDWQFQIRRYKIEIATIDSKVTDTLGLCHAN